MKWGIGEYQGCHVDYGMHPDVTAFALAGKTVVRLKSGIPVSLRGPPKNAGISMRTVFLRNRPGITAALGAAAIPDFH
ncbi:hypothetical protein P4S72_00850 [Vibrio sp. PP-XX7]